MHLVATFVLRITCVLSSTLSRCNIFYAHFYNKIPVFCDKTPCVLVQDIGTYIFLPSTLNLETVISSEKMVSIYQYTWRYVPHDWQLHQCRCENLKSPDTLKADRIKILLSDPVYGSLLCFVSIRDRAQRRRPVVETC